MFVLFVDVLVVVSDALAVGDVLTLGVLCGFQWAREAVAAGAGWNGPCKAEGIVLKIETAMPWVPHMWQLPH